LPTTIASDPGKMALGAADSPQHDKKLADAGAEAPRRGGTFVEEMAPPDYGGPDNMRRNTFMPRTADGLRVTVLLAMAPGDYGIRRGSRTADPILCTQEGCYVSTGADRPARLMPGWQALGFGNVWGVRAGACSNSLTCIFRGVQLGQLPASVQPVDMHILRHDGRLPYLVLTDSGCGVEAGRLICTDGVHTENYAMWIVPEQVAEAAGAAALRRALAEGLDASRAEVSRLAR
jgi:colicin import membrane protein